jgi:hypothetical protein
MRVIKTQDTTRADMIYKDFVRQTLQLSEVEIRRTRLEAQKAFIERMIALSQGRANRLQAGLDVASQQQTIVASQQQKTRAKATALAQQKAAAQDQLRASQRQVRELQSQLGKRPGALTLIFQCLTARARPRPVRRSERCSFTEASRDSRAAAGRESRCQCSALRETALDSAPRRGRGTASTTYAAATAEFSTRRGGI